MKHVMVIAFLVLGSTSPSVAEILPISGTALQDGAIAHGGGCRKSSPPGQCCHMERKTGIVHCH